MGHEQESMMLSQGYRDDIAYYMYLPHIANVHESIPKLHPQVKPHLLLLGSRSSREVEVHLGWHVMGQGET